MWRSASLASTYIFALSVMSDMYRVAVVGARRQRQGMGEYVAREFARCGCDVRAVVGTTEATVEATRTNLRAHYGIESTGYLSLETLLEKESIDIIAICSPANTHLPLLESALEAGCHVFCEKPLWWTPELARLADAQAEVRKCAGTLLERCVQQRRYLAVNTQWPFTLEAFRKLHPGAYGVDRLVEHFSMWLSPVSNGSNMVVDAGPHLLSMLYALVGPGDLQGIRTEFSDLPALGARAGLLLTCGYKHGRGEARVEFKLTRCLKLPRPAGYSINGMSVERHVELSNYMISFVNNGKRVPVPDPLGACVRQFVGSVDTGRRPDRTSVIDGMTQLQELVAAAELRE